MKFKFLTGDIDWITYGGKFVSERLDSGLFNYWLVLDFLNLEEAGALDCCMVGEVILIILSACLF